jgi:PAS domain S-box-containing protein
MDSVSLVSVATPRASRSVSFGRSVTSALSPPRPRAMIVEDEAIVALDLELRLERLGCDVVATTSRGDEAIARFAELRPDLVLMDINLEGTLDGIETARALRRLRLASLVFITAYPDDETLRRASEVTPCGYLLKPLEERTFVSTITVAVRACAASASQRAPAMAFEGASVGIVVAEVHGDVTRAVYANPAWCAITGLSRDEALAGPPRLVGVTPDDPSLAAIAEAFERRENARARVRLEHPDGTVGWFTVRVAPSTGADGAVSHMTVWADEATVPT